MFDQLESRSMFSVSIANGVLTVSGTTGADIMWIAWDQPTSTGTSFAVYDGQQVSYHSVAAVGPNQFSSVSLYGGAGNDKLYAGYTHTSSSGAVYDHAESLLPTTLNAGASSDTVNGSNGGETLLGGSSSDEIYAKNGNDSLNGEGGVDILSGGGGDDVIDARNDMEYIDTLTGGTGTDNFFTNWYYFTSGSYYNKIDVITDQSPSDLDVEQYTVVYK